jgi:serine/threonine protein kinase/tetratricopeptide (TPR) repeat protein
MTPQRWAQIKELFERAMELDPSERARFAEHACAGDQELRREVLRLLDNDIEAESFLSNPPVPAYQPCSWPAGKIILDRFRIIRFVGRGGMGEVYEAQDLALNQRVALKTILPEVARDSRILARFKQEITLARKVTDPHVSRIYELFTDSAPFLTMEFLEGLTLSKRIRSRGSLPEAEARVIALQLCQALEAAHRAGVVHRDFKSGNIMVSTRNGEPWAVVTDFGLATMMVLPEAETATGALTRPGAILGTTPYMAPEQLEGGAVAPATDLYALGIVLYEMLTGRTPFPSATPIAAAMERLKNQPDPPSSVVPGLSRVWDGVIKQCLEYEKEKRPRSAGEVAEKLSSGQRPATIRQKWRTSRRSVGALIVGLLVLGGSLAGWTRWGNNTYRPPSRDAQNRYDEGTAALHEGTYLKAARALERAVMFDKNFVLAHARLADAYTELEYTDKAKDEMVQASSLELLKNLPQVDKDYVEAVRATIARDFPAAVERYERILKALPSSGKAFGLVDLGRAYEKAGQDPEAVTTYERAASEASEYPASFLRLGVLYGRKKRRREADIAFSHAESLYAASSNLEGQAEVEYQEAQVAGDQEQLTLAQTFAQKALEAARAIPDKQLEVRALFILSSIDYRSGELDKSTQEAQKAIQLSQENGIGFFWAGQGLVHLGNTYLLGGDYTKAESYYDQALKLAKNNGSGRLEAMASLSIASVRDVEGRPDEVIAPAAFALDYYRLHGFITNADKAATLLGRSRLANGDAKGALQAFSDEAALGQKTGDVGIRARSEEGLGNVDEYLEQYPGALHHYRSANDLGKQLGPEFVAYQSLHCATAQVALGDFREVDTLLDQARKYHGKPELAADIALAEAQRSLLSGHSAQASLICRSYLEAKKPASPSTQAELTLDLGVAQIRNGDRRSGELNCRKALSLAQAVSPTLRAQAELAVAEAALGSGNLKDAVTFAESAVRDNTVSGRRLSEWRGMALLAIVASRQGDVAKSKLYAKQSLDILQSFLHNWTTTDAERYLRRPDAAAIKREITKLAS